MSEFRTTPDINDGNNSELEQEQENNVDVFETREEAEEVAKKAGPSQRRSYFKKGEYIGSEHLSNIDKEPEKWFTSREEADEYIDAEIEASAVQDEESGDWYVGFKNPKDPEFKGKILE